MKKRYRLDSPEEVQALFAKAEADAKREHCKKCKETGKRYDATNLGYSFGWLYGNADTSECDGCYWNDIEYFRQTMSANYQNNFEL